MGKIVVLASDEDQEAVKAAMDGASLDYEVVTPTAANLLHIAIGMVDENPEEEAPEETPPAPDEGAEPKPDADKGAVGGMGGTPAPKGDIPDEEPKQEGLLGTVKIAGETLNAYAGKDGRSVLYSPNVSVGARTTYSINESQFSFWPADPTRPAQRIVVEHKNRQVTIEVPVQASKREKAYFVAGTDIVDIFKTK